MKAQNTLRKVKSIFKSHALSAIYRWSKPVHGAIAGISLMGVAGSLLSLGLTLVTKSLIDGATGGDINALWKYGILLVVLMGANRGISVLSSALRSASAAGCSPAISGW